jgi:hypothetical protein
MGNEAICRVEIGEDVAEVKALLETGELIVRGTLRARIPFGEAVDVRADGGVLRLDWNGRAVAVHLGRDAEKWAEKIRHPKSVVQKLGVKSGQKIVILGDVDTSFAGAIPFSRELSGEADVVFFAVRSRAELERLDELRRALAPAGAIWVIRRKGVAEITESDVMDAAKRAGLVDVKVVRFSETHTAEKLVIPVARRG